MEGSLSELIGADPLAGIESSPVSAALVDPSSGEINREMARALEIINGNSQFQHRFSKWLSENWSLWQRFEAEAESVWKSGRTRYSARTIIEFLRHETFVRESATTAAPGPDGSCFKINNSYVPDISRLYGLMFPTRADFFECRELKGVSVRVAIRGVAANEATASKASAVASAVMCAR